MVTLAVALGYIYTDGVLVWQLFQQQSYGGRCGGINSGDGVSTETVTVVWSGRNGNISNADTTVMVAADNLK